MRSETRRDPWTIDERDYPATGSLEERLRFLLGYAILAPSSHNAQPWRFRLESGGVALLADRRHALPVCDPLDRQLVIGCGCALRHLELALAHFHGESSTELLPDPAQPDLLARLRLGARRAPDPEATALVRAIPLRRTNRSAFAHRPVAPATLRRLVAGVAAGDAWLEVLEGETKWRVAALVAEADRRQCGDRAFRRELAAWLHAPRSRRRDGMPMSAVGLEGLARAVGPLVVRTFDVGAGRAAHDRELVTCSPVLAVLGTEADRPESWLRAGRALADLLLGAQVAGLAVSFLGQPVELPAMRTRLEALLGHEGAPQLVLRLGHGPPVPPTPRRPVEEVLA